MKNVSTEGKSAEKKNADAGRGPFFKPVVQPKLTINAPNDSYEQEADAVADKIMGTTNGDIAKPQFFSPPVTPVQRDCANCKEGEISRKEAGGAETTASSSLESYIGSLDNKGQALPNNTREFYQARMGHDFSNVKVHTDEVAAKSAQSINALAYTSGNNIVFNNGQYSPATNAGKRLLGHELTHVIQQKNGIGRKIQTVTITSPGTSVHSGLVGAPPAGAAGPPVGAVEVRTGEEIELRPGTRIPNVLAIEYSGAITGNSRWLQFVWFEMTATIPGGTARLTGSVPTSSGTKPFTTNPASPSWSVDSSSTTDPFYDPSGASIRNGSSITMFDAPGGSSASSLAAAVFNAGIGATAVTFTAHFSTFLIQNNHTVYLVPWSASTNFTVANGSVVAGAIGYTVGAAGPAAALPANLKTILLASFPTFTAVI